MADSNINKIEQRESDNIRRESESNLSESELLELERTIEIRAIFNSESKRRGKRGCSDSSNHIHIIK